MTKFLDGPAAGKTLMLRRSPTWLRVVVDPLGEVDALDQLDDTPAREETLYAYRMAANHGTCHIYKRGGGSGFYSRCDYRLIPNQPPDEIMRDLAAWGKWVEEQAKAEGLL